MLKLHKKIHAEGGSSFKSGLYLAAYGIIRSSIANPTDEEYETIAKVCIDAYLKADLSNNIIEVLENAADAYAYKKITLAELKELTPCELLDKFSE